MTNEHQLELELGSRWKEWDSAELVNKVFLGGRRNKRAAASFPFFSAGSGRAPEVNGGGPIKISLNLPVSSSVTAAAAAPQSSGSEIESNNNKNSTTAVSMMSTGVGAAGGQQVPTTRDTLVVLITLTIILITLVASYFFWKKHRSRRRSSYLSGAGGGGAGNNSTHSVYMYSRLSQNDVEVDNISFQGDLTHKAVVNQSGGHGGAVVPSCGVDDDDDDQEVRPATLCLEYDSLVTISNDQHEENHSNDNGGTGRNKNPSLNNRHRLSSSSDVVVDDAPVNLLMDDLSDEDLLQ